MTVLSILPVVGGALVWVPACIILAATGQPLTAVLLAAFCAFVVGSVDNILRPRLVGRDTKMHDPVILFSILGDPHIRAHRLHHRTDHRRPVRHLVEHLRHGLPRRHQRRAGDSHRGVVAPNARPPALRATCIPTGGEYAMAQDDMPDQERSIADDELVDQEFAGGRGRRVRRGRRLGR